MKPDPDGDDFRLVQRRIVEGEVRRMPGSLYGQTQVQVS